MAKKIPSELVSVLIECPCGNQFTIPKENIEVWGDTYECGMCGTHGNSQMIIEGGCPKCGKNIENITLREW